MLGWGLLEINWAITMSIIAAVLAQIINAHYSNKRENKKISQGIFDNYIAPNISNILKFTKKICLNSYDEKSLLKDLRENVDPILKNISYGDKNLFYKRIEEDSKYSSLDAYNIEEQEFTRKLEIQLLFLIYSLKIFKKLKIKMHSNVGNIIDNSIRVHSFLIACRYLNKFNDGYNTLIGLNRLNFDSLSKINKRDLNKLIKKPWDEKVLITIYNKVSDDYQEKFKEKYP